MIVFSAVLTVYRANQEKKIPEPSYLGFSALVSLYYGFLNFSGLESNPDIECNQFYNQNKDASLSMYIGMVITLIVICYAAFTVTEKDTKKAILKKEREDDEEDFPSKNEGGIELESGADKTANDKDEDGSKKKDEVMVDVEEASLVFFYFYFYFYFYFFFYFFFFYFV